MSPALGLQISHIKLLHWFWDLNLGPLVCVGSILPNKLTLCPFCQPCSVYFKIFFLCVFQSGTFLLTFLCAYWWFPLWQSPQGLA